MLADLLRFGSASQSCPRQHHIQAFPLLKQETCHKVSTPEFKALFHDCGSCLWFVWPSTKQQNTLRDLSKQSSHLWHQCFSLENRLEFIICLGHFHLHQSCPLVLLFREREATHTHPAYITARSLVQICYDSWNLYTSPPNRQQSRSPPSKRQSVTVTWTCSSQGTCSTQAEEANRGTAAAWRGGEAGGPAGRGDMAGSGLSQVV
jgi:hypothetical protein